MCVRELGRERENEREGGGSRRDREMLWTVTVQSRRRRYGRRSVDARWILIGCSINKINNDKNRAEAPELIVARLPPCELKSHLCSIFLAE